VIKDGKRDLALIKLSHGPAGVMTLPMQAKSAKAGANVHSVASSAVLDGALCRSPYAGGRRLNEKGRQFPAHLGTAGMIETNAPTNKGDSGGPIVNDRGQMVALVQGGQFGDGDDQQRLVSYNVDIREIHYLLSEYYKGLGKTYELPRLSDVDPGDLLAL